MVTLLSLVAIHGGLDVANLIKLGSISKSTKLDVDHAITLLHKLYNKETIYKDGKEVKEIKIKDRISLTDATKKYKLSDQDLDKLDYSFKYIRQYRLTATFFYKKDVIGLSILKYGKIPGARARGKQTDDRNKRLQLELDKHIAPDQQDWIRSRDICTSFIKNGKQIRLLQKSIASYPKFSLCIDEVPSELQKEFKEENFEQYVDSPDVTKESMKRHVMLYNQFNIYLDSIPSHFSNLFKQNYWKKYLENHEHVFGRMQRHVDLHHTFQVYLETLPVSLKQEFQDIYWTKYLKDPTETEATMVRHLNLYQALASHGLEIRSDSHTCKQYINRSNSNLDNTVKVMRQMAFFYQKTKYKNIIKERMDSVYERAKLQIFEYIEDRDEYMMVLNSMVDKDQVIFKAKCDAIKSFKNALPDYMQEFA